MFKFINSIFSVLTIVLVTFTTVVVVEGFESSYHSYYKAIPVDHPEVINITKYISGNILNGTYTIDEGKNNNDNGIKGTPLTANGYLNTSGKTLINADINQRKYIELKSALSKYIQNGKKYILLFTIKHCLNNDNELCITTTYRRNKQYMNEPKDIKCQVTIESQNNHYTIQAKKCVKRESKHINNKTSSRHSDRFLNNKVIINPFIDMKNNGVTKRIIYSSIRNTSMKVSPQTKRRSNDGHQEDITKLSPDIIEATIQGIVNLNNHVFYSHHDLGFYKLTKAHKDENTFSNNYNVTIQFAKTNCTKHQVLRYCKINDTSDRNIIECNMLVKRSFGLFRYTYENKHENCYEIKDIENNNNNETAMNSNVRPTDDINMYNQVRINNNKKELQDSDTGIEVFHRTRMQNHDPTTNNGHQTQLNINNPDHLQSLNGINKYPNQQNLQKYDSYNHRGSDLGVHDVPFNMNNPTTNRNQFRPYHPFEMIHQATNVYNIYRNPNNKNEPIRTLDHMTAEPKNNHYPLNQMHHSMNHPEHTNNQNDQIYHDMQSLFDIVSQNGQHNYPVQHKLPHSNNYISPHGVPHLNGFYNQDSNHYGSNMAGGVPRNNYYHNNQDGASFISTPKTGNSYRSVLNPHEVFYNQDGITDRIQFPGSNGAPSHQYHY